MSRAHHIQNDSQAQNTESNMYKIAVRTTKYGNGKGQKPILWCITSEKCWELVCIFQFSYQNLLIHIQPKRSKRIGTPLEMNKENLRDLITATDLVILLKLDSNRQYFAHVTLKFGGWPRKLIRHVFYTASSFVSHLISISEFKLELQYGNTQSGSN